MKRGIVLLVCAALAAPAGGCAGTFGGVGRTSKISDASRITARSIIPSNERYRGVIEHLALAEEIYAGQFDLLRERRAKLRSRRRSLTLASYATFAATTLIIGGAAIASASSGDPMTASESGLRTAGYGALAGLGVGTTMEVMNLMQEDPSNVEAKISHLQTSYGNMVDRLGVLFEQLETEGAAAKSIELRAGPIIEAFINDALQINIKG